MRGKHLSARGTLLILLGLGLSLVLIADLGPRTSSPDEALRDQDCPDELVGSWRSALDVAELFTIRFTVNERAPGEFVAEIGSGGVVEGIPVWREGDRLRFQSTTRPIAFDGRVSSEDGAIEGFVQYASTIVHTQLPRAGAPDDPTWSADWNYLGVPGGSFRLDLYIEREGGRVAGAYFFFRDQRLPALWGYGLECQDGAIRLGEKTLGLRLEGRFDRDQDVLHMTATALGGSVPLTFRRMPEELVPELPDAPDAPPRAAANSEYDERAPEALDDGWPTSKPSDEGLDPAVIGGMVRAIVDREMTLVHSVLVARRGRLVVEEYFYGFDRDTWHDMRSASKTVTSTLIGLAVDEGRIESVRASALRFFPRYRQYANWDPRKARITVRDLLTMSSGLDANDSDPSSVASEGAYQSQTERPDWIKLALDAPMIADPGSQPLYGGANPLILGGILAESLEEPVEWFAHRTLFGPLGVAKYKWLLDPTGVVYMGGGLHMRPRDMAKYGQLYLNGGVWRGKRILPEAWVRESWGRYGRLAPLDRNGHQYGYLWWHHVYRVGDRTVETVEARGAGGQYIFVIPSLELVAVITSGNFRNGRYRQPEEILKRFILPAVLHSPESR